MMGHRGRTFQEPALHTHVPSHPSGDQAGLTIAQSLSAILARQCRIAPAEAGALIRIATDQPGDQRVELLAIHPGLQGAAPPPTWVGEAARRTALEGAHRGTMVFPGERPGDASYALVPIAAGTNVWAVYLLSHAPADPGLVAERLAMTAAGFDVLEAQSRLNESGAAIDRLRRTLSALAGLAAHDRFAPAAMALCNHVAAEWGCERASLGLSDGPYVRIAAMSHTEKLEPRSALVQEVEAVMEECFDQDIEVLIPADDDAPTLCRAARAFAQHHGPMAIISVPIRREGAPIGVLTLERPPDAPFSLAEAASLRLLADAASAQVWLVHRYRRWFGATLAASLRSMVAGALGPSYAWAKLSALALAAAALFFALVPGTYRVRGDARVESTDRRVIAGPFDGFLLAAHAKAGDLVNQGDLLANLDTTDILLRLGSLRAERDGSLREAALAQREGKDAEGQIAKARARRADADIKFLERQAEQAAIRAPATGAIVTGDLDRVVGAPVKMGDTLHEIASLDSLLVEAYVSEDQIADVAVGSRAALAPASRPDLKIQVTITRIDPVAQLRQGRNVFRVVGSLAQRPDWLRPGMEGTLRIDAGSRSYPWIWTRRVVNWARMQLWI